MSNVAGKSYAMNTLTPLKWYTAWINKVIFRGARLPVFSRALNGLITLSLIQYSKWAIVKPTQFPRLHPSQPKENLKYSYMFFFSNFNGSWEQYVDSFHMAIPSGLDLFWRKNLRYPRSVPLHHFHAYINYNQIWTGHYYNAYPSASSNDVKAAMKIKSRLRDFVEISKDATPDEFMTKYNALLNDVQNDLGLMAPTPIVSLAAAAVESRREAALDFRNSRSSPTESDA